MLPDDIHTAPSGACWRALPHSLDAVAVFQRLGGLPGRVFFDSSYRHNELGRYSFLAADPYDWIECGQGQDGFSMLQARLEAVAEPTISGLPPFQGGAAGYWGYELCHALERLPWPRRRGIPTPGMAVGLYDVVVAFDHAQRAAWLISQGLPAGRDARAEVAKRRLLRFWERLSADAQPAAAPALEMSTELDLPPLHPLPGHDGVQSDFTRGAYVAAVQRAVDYIHAGDVFQVNLTQRLLAPLGEAPEAYYLRLRRRSPAPFAAFFDAGETTLCSASPERFLSVRGAQVQTRPIKGTRPRSSNQEEDARLAQQLLASEKDRAENTMIVDLLRNDLSRVCTDDSVVVPVLCGLESYEHVHHLVSVVNGRLRDGVGRVDLLRACFPGGSITGAPKVRAMEIIAELESTPRGPYCGAFGYIGFDGAMDSSILIRTAIASHGWLQMPVGGGVVADSDPQAEHAETLQKAAGMLAALPRAAR